MAYAFTLPPVGVVPARSAAQTVAPVLSPGAIGHTGTSSYLLASSPGGSGGAAVGGADDDNEDRKGGGGGGGGAGGAGRARATQSPSEPLTELADVVGQLSLNENAEVRYHGRSSGLYLIAKSQRFKEFFWRFPSAGVWPPADHGAVKTEAEILRLVGAEDALPDMETQSQLLSAYWAYVHPHFPISFMRQYRHTLAHPDSTEPSTPAGTGKVPVVLLLAMFALAARYCDLDRPTEPGKYWEAGQEYLDKARRILNHDYGSSKLVTVQALLLLSYREIGVGAMSSSWMLGGMAIRMAQDLGLFRDVEKWYLPIQRFTHEEKQARKRVWWACVILDRYTSSYIGRPGTIHERDYDCGFPSEDEPDEHEQWRPIRLDGTEWTAPPNVNRTHPGSGETVAEDNAKFLKAYPPTRAHTLSCFNAAGALAVIINRIISNIYAIRIRVLGQSSETLLSLLDQSLASWYLALPPHLQYNPASSKVPPPHILSLHLQFYSSLILLHRPFSASPGSFPSHSICTTSANAIAKCVSHLLSCIAGLLR
ncbi:fungal-specific transcription factor domain-containing protein [Rhodotorula diobovata]|uniref:Fungal-specific transcription factor domain-containing protein n=1 Tax=Rhodotorula diobovata TaxID=5288 RepID=A0A5C5FTN1_9BASI|nr:fungal-specific transcription factor domain-containing protein [Rhodotorula diobovata]